MLPNLATGRVRAAVKVISSDDLIENGGSFRLQGRVAFRVNNLTGQTSLPASHQAMAVYPVTQADIDSGRFVLAGGGPAVRVVDIDTEGISRAVMGGGAVPVYVVEGEALGVIPLDPPDAPTDLLAIQNGTVEGRVDLSWVSNSDNETGFSIERSYHVSTGFAEIDTVAAGESTYSDTTAGSGYYYYRVRAFNLDGYSDYTSEEELPVYWERDEFITADAAPITSPRTMEPGPGTLTTVADSASHGAIVSGELRTDGGAVANTDPLYVGAGRSRIAGMAYGINLRQAADVNSFLGWRTAQSGANTTFRGAFRMVAQQVYQYNNGVFTFTGLAFALSTTYQLVAVMLPVGTAMYIKGGAFTTWTLAWVDRADSTATMYPGIARATTAGDHFHDNWSVCQLGAPFDGAYNMADTAVAGSVSSGQAFTHATNFAGYIVITTLPNLGQEILLKFSIQDASNYWAAVVDSTGTMVLREVVAGVATIQGTALTAVSAGERIGVRRITASNNILVYDTTSTNPLISKGAATNFITETDGEIVIGTGGAVSNLEIHDATARSAIQTELDRFFG